MSISENAKREEIRCSIDSAPVTKDVNPLSTDGKGIIHQRLATDPDTGMFVQRIVYECGICPGKHRHTCGHGIFVLKGTLKTDTGLYGPGSFFWWPAGVWMIHGATEEEDVEVLFITNKPFDIEFDS